MSFKNIPIIGLSILLSSGFVFPQIAFSDDENPPSVREKKTQEGYIINLKDLIKESKQKIEKVDDKIQEQAKLRRNQQREEKAREYYQKAMQLFEDGNYPEAQEYWNKAIKITEHPEMKDYINESVKKTSKQEALFRSEEGQRLERLESERGFSVSDVEKGYQEAVSLYKQKKFLEAKDQFTKVDEMFPDHKATRSYLMLIDREIEKQQQELIDQKVKNEAMALKKEKEAWKEELDKKEAAQEQATKDQAESLYKEAVELYGAKDFDASMTKFQNVESVIPNYRDTSKYLTKLEIELKAKEKKKEEELAQQRRDEEEKAENARKEEEARQAKLRKKDEEEKARRLNDEASFSYDAAISLYAKRLYLQAKDKFLEVEKIFPDFKATKQYLARIDKDISDENLAIEAERKKVLDQKQKEEQLAKEKEEETKRKQRELDEKQRQEKLTQEAEGLYKTAVSLYDTHKFQEAKEKFEQLQRVYLGYKSVAKYLSRIDLDIAEEENRQAQAKQKELEERQRYESLSVAEKETFEEKKRLEQEKENARLAKEAQAQERQRLKEQKKQELAQRKADETQQRAVSQEDAQKAEEKARRAKLKEEERLAKVKEAQDSQAQKMLNDQAEGIYKEALALYKSKEFDKAKARFNDCLFVVPDYKQAQKYLARIEDDKLKYEHDKNEAQDEFLSKVKEEKEKQLAEEERNKSLSDVEKIKSLLNKAKKSQRQKDYQQAKDYYQQVLDLDANQEAAKDNLLKIEELMAQEQEKLAEKEEQKSKEQERLQVKEQSDQTNQIVIEEKTRKEFLREEEKSRLKQEKKEKEERIKAEKDAKFVQLKQEQDQKQSQQQQAEKSYQEAVKFYQAKDYSSAQSKFQEAMQIIPSYKSSEKYLTKIQDKLYQSVQTPSNVVEVRTPIVPVKESKVMPVIGTSDQVIRQAEEDRRRKISKEAEERYVQALDYFKVKKYLEAKSKFIEVEMLSPGYKQALSYIGQVDDILKIPSPSNTTVVNEVSKVLEKEEPSSQPVENVINNNSNLQETIKKTKIVVKDENVNPEAEKMYLDAKKIYKRKQFVVAKEKFEELNQKFPGYKDTEILLDKTSEIIAKEVKEMAVTAAQVETKKFETVNTYDDAVCKEYQQDFNQAVQNYKEGKLVQARAMLMGINSQSSCQERVKNYLALIEKDLRKQSLKQRKEVLASVKERPLNDYKRFSKLDSSSIYGWKENMHRADVLLKLKRQQLKVLEGDRYKSLKERIEYEEQVKQKVLRDRKIEDSLRHKTIQKRVHEEARAKEDEQERRAQAEALAKEEEEKRLKAEELAKKKEEEKRLAEERKRQQEEEKKRKEEEAARKKEEERLAKEEKLRQLEEQKKNKTEVIVNQDQEATGKDGKSTDDKILTQYDYQHYKDELKREDAKKDLNKLRQNQNKLRSKLAKDLKNSQAEIDKTRQRKKSLLQSEHINDVEKIYQEAMTLFNAKCYVAAKAKFSMVEGLYPGYKSAASYIKNCEEKDALEQQKTIEQKQKDLQVQEENQKNQEEMQAQEKLKQEKLQAKLDLENKKKQEAEEKKRLKEQAKQKKLLEKKEISKKKDQSEDTVKQEVKQPVEEVKNKTENQEYIKTVSDENQKKQDMREKAKKERENRLAIVEDKKMRAEKEQDELRKRQEKEESLAKASQEKKARNGINAEYKELQLLIKSKNYKLAEDKINRIDQHLMGDMILSKDYIDQMREHLSMDKNRIAQLQMMDVQKEKEYASKRDEESNRVKDLQQQKSKDSLVKIEQTIQSQEEQLARERKILEDRLARERKREEDRLEQEKRMQEERDRREKSLRSVSENQSTQAVMSNPSKQTQWQTEKSRQEDLKQLAKKKEESLKQQREAVKAELDQRLFNLYKRGVTLFQQGSLIEAKNLFVEIQEMSGGYRDVSKMINQIDRKISGQSNIKQVKQKSIKQTKSTKSIAPTREDYINNSLNVIEGKLW